MSLRKSVWLWPVTFIIFSCCTVSRKQAVDARLAGFKYNYCSPSVPYPRAAWPWPDSTNTDLSSTPLTVHDQLVCHILCIGGAADSLWQLRGKAPTDVTNALKQEINGRLFIALSQIQAVAAELDCEGERANQAANYLDGITNRQKTHLTVASVIVGALTTVGAVTAPHGNPQTFISIGGGLLSAGLGALTINPKGKKIAFYHERNLLRTIWNHAASNTDYPDIVWAMLHEQKLSNTGDITLAESIRTRWLQFEFNGKVGGKQAALLFGDGGLYDAGNLHTRAAMINQLQATIRSFYQDLSSTVAALENM